MTEENEPVPLTKVEVKADARDRSKRTFYQGLAFAVLAAVSTAILQVVGNWTHNDFLTTSSWLILGTAILQASVMAGFAYIQRITMAPPKDPTTE